MYEINLSELPEEHRPLGLVNGVFWFHRNLINIEPRILKKVDEPTNQKFNFVLIQIPTFELYGILIDVMDALDTLSVKEPFTRNNCAELLELTTHPIFEGKYRIHEYQFTDETYYLNNEGDNFSYLTDLIQPNTLLLGPTNDSISIQKSRVLKRLFNHSDTEPYFKIAPFKHPIYTDLKYSHKLNMTVVTKYFQTYRRVCLIWPINGCSYDEALDPGFKHLHFTNNRSKLDFKIKFKKIFMKCMKCYYSLDIKQQLILTWVFQQSIGIYQNVSNSSDIFNEVSQLFHQIRHNSISKQPFINYKVTVKCNEGDNNVNCTLKDRVYLTHEKGIPSNRYRINRVYPTFRLEDGNLVTIPDVTAFEFIKLYNESNGNFYRSLDLYELLIFVPEEDNPAFMEHHHKFMKLKANFILRKSVNKFCIMICDADLECINIWRLLEEDNTSLITHIYDHIDAFSCICNIHSVKHFLNELVQKHEDYESNKRVKNKIFKNTYDELEQRVPVTVPVPGHAGGKKNKTLVKKTKKKKNLLRKLKHLLKKVKLKYLLRKVKLKKLKHLLKNLRKVKLRKVKLKLNIKTDYINFI